MDIQDTHSLNVHAEIFLDWIKSVRNKVHSILPIEATDKICSMLPNQRIRYLMSQLNDGIIDNEYLKLKIMPLFDVNLKQFIPENFFKVENQFGDEGQCLDMLIEFTRKILFAPTNSIELSSLFKDRSELLFNLSMFESCIQDISYINLGFFPVSVQKEIHRRKAKCHIGLTIQSLTKVTDNPVIFNDLDDHIVQDAIELFEEAFNVSIDKGNEVKLNQTLPSFENKNEIIPDLSDDVKLNFTEAIGCHVIAARDIKPGELIGACKTYVTTLSRDERFYFCWHCGKQTLNGIPCERCPSILYCSNYCRDESWDQSHFIECPILPLLFKNDDNNIIIMALKTTIKAFKECDEQIEKLFSLYNVNAKPPTKDELFDSDHDPNKYSSVQAFTREYNYLDNVNNSFYFANSLMLTIYMSVKIGLIKGNESLSDLNDKDKFIDLLTFIDNNMRLINFNKVICGYGDETNKSTILTPSSMNFKHQCYSQIARIHIGNRELIFTTENIKKGKIIGDSYFIPEWIDMELMKRQLFAKVRIGSNYKCTCTACIFDWKINKLPQTFNIVETDSIKNDIASTRKEVQDTFANVINHYCQNAELIDSTKVINKTKNIVTRCQKNRPFDPVLLYEAKELLETALYLLQPPFILPLW